MHCLFSLLQGTFGRISTAKCVGNRCAVHRAWRFFATRFARPRCSPRISFPPNSCGRPFPQQSEQLRFSCFGSRSQRFENAFVKIEIATVHHLHRTAGRYAGVDQHTRVAACCCSTHAWLHARAQQCSGQLHSATAMEQPGPAIDRCTLRPRWTDAPRACDGRMQPAPAMDGCTPQAIGAGFAWTEQAVLTTLDAAHAVVLLPANALTCAGSACSDRTTSDRQGSGFAWTQQAAGVV